MSGIGNNSNKEQYPELKNWASSPDTKDTPFIGEWGCYPTASILLTSPIGLDKSEFKSKPILYNFSTANYQVFPLLIINSINAEFQKNLHLLHKRLECSPMAWEAWVQSQVESYQRIDKWYLMPPCLTLSIIRYGSRVKRSNRGKE